MSNKREVILAGKFTGAQGWLAVAQFPIEELSQAQLFARENFYQLRFMEQ